MKLFHRRPADSPAPATARQNSRWQSRRHLNELRRSVKRVNAAETRTKASDYQFRFVCWAMPRPSTFSFVKGVAENGDAEVALFVSSNLIERETCHRSDGQRVSCVLQTHSKIKVCGRRSGMPVALTERPNVCALTPLVFCANRVVSQSHSHLLPGCLKDSSGC